MGLWVVLVEFVLLIATLIIKAGFAVEVRSLTKFGL